MLGGGEVRIKVWQIRPGDRVGLMTVTKVSRRGPVVDVVSVSRTGLSSVTNLALTAHDDMEVAR